MAKKSADMVPIHLLFSEKEDQEDHEEFLTWEVANSGLLKDFDASPGPIRQLLLRYYYFSYDRANAKWRETAKLTIEQGGLIKDLWELVNKQGGLVEAAMTERIQAADAVCKQQQVTYNLAQGRKKGTEKRIWAAKAIQESLHRYVDALYVSGGKGWEWGPEEVVNFIGKQPVLYRGTSLDKKVRSRIKWNKEQAKSKRKPQA